MSGAGHFWLRPLRAVHRCGWMPPEHVAVALRRFAVEAHPRETGGLLLGWWEQEVPVVAGAVEVPDPAATGTRWTRHSEAAAAALRHARATGDPTVGYVGDWHTHPADLGPSPQDLRQTKQDSTEYPHALALVVVRHGGRLDTRLALHGRPTTLSKLKERST